MKTFKGEIYNWGIVFFPLGKGGAYVVVGEMDGEFVRSSPVVELQFPDRKELNPRLFLETENSRYLLIGQPKHKEVQEVFEARYGSIIEREEEL